MRFPRTYPNVSGAYLVFEAEAERLDVDVKEVVDILLSDFREKARPENTRVVEGHVQPSKLLDRDIYHLFAVCFLRVGSCRKGRRAKTQKKR